MSYGGLIPMLESCGRCENGLAEAGCAPRPMGLGEMLLGPFVPALPYAGEMDGANPEGPAGGRKPAVSLGPTGMRAGYEGMPPRFCGVGWVRNGCAFFCACDGRVGVVCEL